MTTNSTAYERLATRFAKMATIDEAAGVLSWDAAAMMPDGGAAARGDQMAVLAGLAHGLMVAPEVADELAEAEAVEDGEDPWRARNLELMRHEYTRATALPADLVEALVRATSACEMVWREARAAADFARVTASLDEVVRLTREKAAALGEALGMGAWDALADGYQAGIGEAEITPVFDAYEAFLKEALPRAEAVQAARGEPMQPRGPFAVDVQEALGRRLAEMTGLERAHFRLDRSAHPFCGGTPTDVRITTRYNEANFSQALLGVLHESGHALYSRGLPTAWARQPVGAAAGMAAHESQSLIIEMQACRSDAFIGWIGGELHAAFGGDAAAYDPDNLVRLWRRVARSYIRVEADEMTYPAHVILRYRLELAMLAGDLAVSDLPGAWNEGFAGLLGVVPPDDAQGVLQDIHWYYGLIGYFPSYTLGAMGAAQLMAAARRALPGMDAALGRGDLSLLVTWLRANVHGKGSLLGFNDLLAQATGNPLDPAYFTEHLKARYL